MTDPTSLSTAAQAVKDAVLATYADNIPKDNNLWTLERASTVAALRAVIDKVVPEQQIPRGHLVNLGGDTIEVFPQSARIPIQKLRLLQEVRNNFLVIITELENQ